MPRRSAVITERNGSHTTLSNARPVAVATEREDERMHRLWRGFRDRCGTWIRRAGDLIVAFIEHEYGR